MYKIFAREKAFFITLIFFAVAACSSPTPPINQQPINFSQYAPINVDVARIDLIEEYKSPFAAPNVEHLMPYSPADAMQIWVKDRLRAKGSAKLAQVSIIDASVVATDLPKTQGIKGLFTNDQDKRYDARLEVEIRIYGDSALSEASTSVEVTRNITIPENASVNSRKATYNQLVADLMKMLNEKLEKNIHQYLNNYIK